MTKGTSSDPLVGTLIGDRYILERQLGRGSHGFVYRATHNEIPRAYAIKFLRPSFGGHLAPAKLERFRREAFSLASLRHPAVVQVTDYGVHSELGPYLVM
ncbi:MAG: protein kinase domain-containing protein, partial [Nannocystaceae bacterium]